MKRWRPAAASGRPTIRSDDVTAVNAIGTDRAVFEVFYLEHFDTVLGFVTRRVTDAHTAADLTAEVFVAALSSASGYRGDGTAAAWLMGIARRVVAAEYRRAATERAAQQQVGGRRSLDAQEIEALEERIDAERSAREVYQHVQRLPASQRVVVELVAVDGLSLTDAAAVLDIRPATARVRWFRARRFLQEIPRPPSRKGATPTVSIPVEAQS
jgi:RNA polymerase sigma-70 factor (ECF subfamily)